MARSVTPADQQPENPSADSAPTSAKAQPDVEPNDRPPPRAGLRGAPATALLFAICLFVFAAAERDGDTTTSETLVRWGAAWRGLVWQGEWWRLATSMFLHIGPVHLLWNLFAGWSWCAPMERRVGTPRFLFLYLGSGLVASATSVAAQDAVSAGASGAMFGIVGALLALDRLELGSWQALAAKQGRTLRTIVLWLAVGPFVGFDNWAHIGGLVAGAAFAWLLSQPARTGARLAAVSMLLVVPISLVPRSDAGAAIQTASRLERATHDGNWHEALAVLDEFERSPEFERYEAWADYERLRALTALGELDAGVAWSESRLALGATVERYLNCARAHGQAGNGDAGLHRVEQALLLEPGNGTALVMRAQYRLGAGDAAGGLADARAAVLALPDDPASRLTLAWAHSSSGDPSAALAELHEAERLGAASDDIARLRPLIDKNARRASDGGAR